MRQRNMFQMKNKIKPQNKNPNEMKRSNLLDKAFKETITGMLTEFGRRKEELRKNFNKDLENIRKNKSELKNTRTEIKNILEGINSN